MLLGCFFFFFETNCLSCFKNLRARRITTQRERDIKKKGEIQIRKVKV